MSYICWYILIYMLIYMLVYIMLIYILCIYFLLFTSKPLKDVLGAIVYDPKLRTYSQSPILSS